MSEDRNPNERDSPSPAWIGGAVMILIGLAFLVRNLTGYELNNWWAFFLLIPAVGAFNRAYQVYDTQGRLNREARGSLFTGLGFTFVASIFLLGLDFGSLWPVFLILAGLGLLINALLPS